MKGEITTGGSLIISRGQVGVYTTCPFSGSTVDRNTAHCGDWCALFGEPEEVINLTKDPDDGSIVVLESDGRTKIQLCHKTLVFDEFVDERGK